MIIAGPNGAGKTSFANEYLSSELRFDFVNADEIARNVPAEFSTQEISEIRAGRIMLERIEELVATRADFAIETTLASLIYAKKIPDWRELGYTVSLIYLRLPTVQDSLARVKKRVQAGGHDIPEEVIRRRFSKSNQYFEQMYKSLVDEWQLWESLEGEFTKIDTGRRE